MKTISLLNKKLPVVVLAGVLITAGAGAAAGVTFSGTIQGEATSTVDQALLMTSLDAPDSDTNNDLGQVSDDGTKFEFAADVNQGELYHLNANLDNKGSQNINGELTLKVPEPLEVEVQGNNDIDIARTSMSTWTLNVDPGESVTESANNGQSTYTTSEPVADRNNDGSVDEDDIDISNANPDKQTNNNPNNDIEGVEVNADGTVTVKDDKKFDGGDEFTYESGANLVVVVAIPDDAQPGFYTIKGELKPTEV